MFNLEIYCTSLQYFNVLDKLPPYIKPLGLGNRKFPKHWLTETNGENIVDLKYHISNNGLFLLFFHFLKF